MDPEYRETPPGRLNWAAIKRLIRERILQVDDTPHRIAFGVLLGFIIGATPTIGLQMILYFFFATILSANKVSGILPVWLSNPVTAVPLYSFNWWLGMWILTGNPRPDSARQAEVLALIEGAPGQDLPIWERIFSGDFWTQVWHTFLSLGIELWVGSLIVGVVLGVIGYWAAYRGVIRYRARNKKEVL